MILQRLFCFILVLGFATHCFAQQKTPETDKLFTADVLKATVVAKTAAERNFCDYVIQKRDDGTIPTRIIYGVYRNAITKDRNRRFAYFKTGLEFVCKREGIVLYPTPVTTSPSTPFLTLPSFKNFFQRN